MRSSTVIKSGAVLAALAFIPLAAVASSPAAGDCGAFIGSIKEVQEFTPYEMQRSHLPDVTLNPQLEPQARLGSGIAIDAVNGLQRQWATLSATGEASQYFASDAITEQTTLSEFQRQGGIEVDTTPFKAGGSPLADMKESLGSRAIEVPIGTSVGLVVWADPVTPDGQRMHHVYWEQESILYSVIGDLGPETAVTTARQVACR